MWEDPGEGGDAYPEAQLAKTLPRKEEGRVGEQFISGTTRAGMREVRGPSGKGGQEGGAPGKMAVGVDSEPGLFMDNQHMA